MVNDYIISIVGNDTGTRRVTCASVDEAREALRDAYADAPGCLSASIARVDRDYSSEYFMRIEGGVEQFFSCYE